MTSAIGSLVVVLPHVALDRLLDVRAIEHLLQHGHAVVAAVRASATAAFQRTSGVDPAAPSRSVASCASPGSAPSA